MDEVLKQIENIKRNTDDRIQQLNIEIIAQAKAVSDVLDVIEDYVPITHREGLYLDYKKYLKLINEQQDVYNGSINALIGVLPDFLRGSKERLQHAFNEGYKRGKAKSQEEKNVLTEKLKTSIKEKASIRDELIELYETYIEDLEQEIERIKRQPPPAQTIAQREAKPQPVAIGKAIELSKPKIKEIIMLYVKGLSISAINKETKQSREKVRAVLYNKYKHPASKKKILSVINKLLKENQNPKTIEKLKELKNNYS